MGNLGQCPKMYRKGKMWSVCPRVTRAGGLVVPDAHPGTAWSPEPCRHGGNREKPGGNGIHALQLQGWGWLSVSAEI